MVRQKGGSGRNQGRKFDWGQKPDSTIGVPYKLAEQKKYLVKLWTTLQQAGLELEHLAGFLENEGVDLIQQTSSGYLLSSSNVYKMYSTSVAASFGVTSSMDAEAGGYEEIYLESVLGIKSPNRAIFLKVTGYSMVDDEIFPGATLTVETRDTTMSKSWLDAQTGDTVIALIDGVDVTVKKFRRTNEGEFLVPRNRKNKNFQQIQISSCSADWMGGHEVEIFGIVRKIVLDP